MVLVKLIMAMALVLGMGVATGISERTNDPIPHCLPCPDNR